MEQVDRREHDRVLTELERVVVQARLALHAAEDAGRFTVPCADTDGDGDCPRCLTRTGFSAGEPQYWRCSREAERLQGDAEKALWDAAMEARAHAQSLALIAAVPVVENRTRMLG